MCGLSAGVISSGSMRWPGGEISMHADDLLSPQKLWFRHEVLSRPSPIPKSPGVYAWYFRGLESVPSGSCRAAHGHRLLYIGISPSAPPSNGKAPSSQSLQSRVRYHYSGNAEGSTLRLTLGCLLAQTLGIELRRVGSGTVPRLPMTSRALPQLFIARGQTRQRSNTPAPRNGSRAEGGQNDLTVFREWLQS